MSFKLIHESCTTFFLLSSSKYICDSVFFKKIFIYHYFLSLDKILIKYEATVNLSPSCCLFNTSQIFVFLVLSLSTHECEEKFYNLTDVYSELIAIFSLVVSRRLKIAFCRTSFKANPRAKKKMGNGWYMKKMSPFYDSFILVCCT